MTVKNLRNSIPKHVEVEAGADTKVDLATLGSRIRHARTAKGMTLAALAARINRASSYLSQIENGRREPKLSVLTSIAEALGVTVSDLMIAQAPSERASLELQLKAAQTSPLAAEWGIPHVHVGPRLPTDALRALTAAYGQLKAAAQHHGRSPEAAREANLILRAEMRAKDNYLGEIEEMAGEICRAVGFEGGPLLQSGVESIARYLGFEIVHVGDVPAAARSITDLRTRRIYLPLSTREDKDPRMLILRALGDQALNHPVPSDFYEFLSQRVLSNYFASAILLPERPTVARLKEAMIARDIAISDLRDMAAVRYETAAHRFTNLATKHLGLRAHFLRVGLDGIIYKAYANNGLEFPTGVDGSIEGQIACQYFGARQVAHSVARYEPWYQYTDTPTGTYWSVGQVESYRAGEFSITVGVPFEQASYFRGRDTTNRRISRCPDPDCCRNPSPALQERWADYAWPSVRAHSHLLAAIPPGSFPGLDDREVYEFLDSHALD